MTSFMECAREVYGRYARIAVGALIVLASMEVVIMVGLAAKALKDFG